MRNIPYLLALPLLCAAPRLAAQDEFPLAPAPGAPIDSPFRLRFQAGAGSALGRADVQQIVRLAIGSRYRRPREIPDGADPPPAYLDVVVRAEEAGGYAIEVGCVSSATTHPDAQEPIRATATGTEAVSILGLGAVLALVVREETTLCRTDVPAP